MDFPARFVKGDRTWDVESESEATQASLDGWKFSAVPGQLTLIDPEEIARMKAFRKSRRAPR